MLFLLFRRGVLKGAFWLTKQASLLAWRNANLQTLILAPLIVVLLLLPAAFDRGDRGSPKQEPQVSPTSYAPTSYDQPQPSWLGSR